MTRILSVFILFLSRVLISAEDGSLSLEEDATDAQMWCHSKAPSPEAKPSVSHLAPYGFPYDIQSSSCVCIMHWSTRIVSISGARSPSFTRDLRCSIWDSLLHGSLGAVMGGLLRSWPLIVSPCLFCSKMNSCVDEDVCCKISPAGGDVYTRRKKNNAWTPVSLCEFVTSSFQPFCYQETREHKWLWWHRNRPTQCFRDSRISHWAKEVKGRTTDRYVFIAGSREGVPLRISAARSISSLLISCGVWIQHLWSPEKKPAWSLLPRRRIFQSCNVVDCVDRLRRSIA